MDTSEEVRSGKSGEDLLNAQGAGDQGMMFGYACNETEALMPLPIWLAHRMAERLAEVRRADVIPYLRPDGKTQVTFDYEGTKPVRLRTVLISTQHAPGIDRDSMIRPDLIEHVIRPVVPEQFRDDDYTVLVNPTGQFVLGGPHADTGLTGRKIIVDTYGGMARHGGGAFSGKDPSKVDRSAAYAARWVAKHVVASGAAGRCEVQVAYAIGVAQPVSILVETFGTETVGPVPHRAGRPRRVRSAPGGHHQRAQPAPAHLPAHRGLRPLRAGRARVHVGAARQPGELQGGGRRLSAQSGAGPPRWRGSSPTSPASTRSSTTWSPTRSARSCASGRWSASHWPAGASAVGSWAWGRPTESLPLERCGRWPRSPVTVRPRT